MSTSIVYSFISSSLFKFSAETIVETILFNFSVMHSVAVNRKDLISLLENLFSTHLPFFYTAGPLIKNRVCLMIKYYLSYLFFHEENSFLEIIQYVLFCCKEKSFAIVNIQASETLAFLLQEEDVLLRIYNFLPSIISSLIETLKYQNNKQFFEVFFEIIELNIEHIILHLSDLMLNLVSKIAEVQRNSYENKKKDKIIIDKC